MRHASRPYWLIGAVIFIALVVLALLNGCGRDKPASSQQDTLIGALSPDSIADPGMRRMAGITLDSVTRESTAVWSVTTDRWITVKSVDTVHSGEASVGVPFIAMNLWTQSSSAPNTTAHPFSASANSSSPTGLVTQINAARALGHSLILTMTGGGHDNYLTDPARPSYDCPKAGGGGCLFDMAKWKARQKLFDTPANRAAVAQAVEDGTVIGANVLDELQHSSWGMINGQSYLTKAMADEMAAYVKSIFPTLPVGVSMKFSWRPTEKLTKMDWVLTQYVQPWGDVSKWRDSELAGAKLNGVKVIFSMNILNGGAGFGMTSCPKPATGGFSPVSTGRCSMSPAQIREYAMGLAGYGCALNVWEYNATYLSNADTRRALDDVAAIMKNLPARSCRR